jgi:hypothetical protein
MDPTLPRYISKYRKTYWIKTEYLYYTKEGHEAIEESKRGLWIEVYFCPGCGLVFLTPLSQTYHIRLSSIDTKTIDYIGF